MLPAGREVKHNAPFPPASTYFRRAWALCGALHKAHTRRASFEAQAAQPLDVGEAPKRIGQLYRIEEQIRENTLAGESKRNYRLTHSRPRVELLFECKR